jgi:predicted nucleic acid-binding protein
VAIRRKRDSEQIYSRLIAAAEDGTVRTVRQVFGELRTHHPVFRVLAPHRAKFQIPIEEQFSPEVQAYLDVIGNDAPFLYAVVGDKNPDPADPFLVAVAAAHGYSLATNESDLSQFKIPAVCRLPQIGARCINGAHFLVEIGIVEEIKPEHLSPAAFFRD